MPISQYRDLFHPPSTLDKLNLLQSLVDSKDLIPALALSFINVIRAELEQPQKQNASAYRRYSEVTGSLCQQMPEVYGQVVDTWQERRRNVSSTQIAEVLEGAEVGTPTESESESDHLVVESAEATAESEQMEGELPETDEEEHPPVGME